MEMKQFNKMLSTLDKQLGSAQEEVHAMGVFALHCINVGKTGGEDSPIQRLWDVLNKYKGINRQAFMDWAKAFGCLSFVKQEDGNFLIKYVDKTKKDINFNPEEAVKQAEAMPYWEFSKEPTPNTSPFDVFEKLRQVLAQAKSAATGGAKQDKPVRQIQHKEGLDMIQYILANPELARQKLGLTLPSEVAVPVFGEAETQEIAELMQKAIAGDERQELKAA